MTPNPELVPWKHVDNLMLLPTKTTHLDGVRPLEQRLTCANHTDEDTILEEIGWNNFNCPKCGRDYSIGRKISVRKSY
jgi:predicted RNA-binding Zn-ribbon protein involved in translation (DUF1610 family)